MSEVLENSPKIWQSKLPVLEQQTHKYKRGYVLVNAGEMASAGATKLAAYAALRAGAGLVSVACSHESLLVYAISLTAVMTKLADSLNDFQKLINNEKVTAILLGPGNGVNIATKERVLAALVTKKPIVLDADALTSFDNAPETLFNALHMGAVITPHEGEYSRLFLKAQHSKDRIEIAKQAAVETGAIVVLKGHQTVIASPCERVVINKNAPAELATAGSGDVLSGIIAGLLAQSMPTFEAACAAVWIHAQAARMFGRGLISEDLSDKLPNILQKLYAN